MHTSSLTRLMIIRQIGISIHLMYEYIECYLRVTFVCEFGHLEEVIDRFRELVLIILCMCMRMYMYM